MTKNVSKSDLASTRRRYLALWFPYLTTDRLHCQHLNPNFAKPNDQPLAVVAKERGALRITAVDQRAARLGLIPGSTLADARALLPELAIAEADDKADARLIERLTVLSERFTPTVALDLPNGLMLDITGCAHLLGTEENLRAEVVARLVRLGLQVRATIAGTPDAARALARFSRTIIAPDGQDETLARTLPVAALAGVERETIIALSRAGLTRLGHLADRPPQVLAARFGPSIVTQLLRTLGREDSRLTPHRPLPAVVVERRFAEPLSQMEALEGVLALLIEEAVLALQERNEGGRVFETSLFRSDGDVRRLAVETGHPSRDAAIILKLYHERLTTLADPIDAGYGFDVVRLAVPVAEPLEALQPRLDGHATEDDAVGDLVDRLIVRFGRDRVLRFEAQDTHDPDREARLVAANRDPGTARILWSHPEPGEPPLRPLHLFDPPQPIEALAEVPDGPPLRFRWRRVLHDVARAEGPERIAPEWWRKKSAEPRDYYRVEDATGHRFWVFRQGTYRQGVPAPRWFLHGMFA